MRLALTALFISAITISAGELDITPGKPVKGNSIYIDYKDGIPIFARGFPSYTEIKDPKTRRTWIDQLDGTLKEKASGATQ